MQFNTAHHGSRLSVPWILFIALISASCTTPTGPTSDDSSLVSERTATLPVTDQAMIQDHVALIEQIFDPLGTTFQITNSVDDQYLRLFTTLLAGSGYGIQRVTADQGANYLTYSLDRRSTSPERVTRLTTRIGNIEITRDYTIDEGVSITPVSSVRLSGSRKALRVDESTIANKQAPVSEFSDVTYIASLGLEEQSPIISLVTPDLVDRITSETVRARRLPPSDPDAPSLQALNSNRMEVNNLFYADTTAFNSILDGFTKVHRQILVFGNDSLTLGSTNKSLIEQFINSRVRDNDLISLVGCSNGHTDLSIGNEGLALGRAKRVTEELLARGVARDRILDEGCWAPVSAGDDFPARGVVMELWRRAS